MANIQPFNYQESTNIEEHNQIVNKVNEIVQVINNVNLDTINSEIADLKSKATATDTEIANIKNKDTTQDTEIDGITKNLVSNVTATFDNPSRELKISLGREVSPSIDATVVIPASSETGQYSAGNGITIENYQIAVDTGVVALKTDIPVVPDVTEINNRLDNVDTEISGIMTDITNINNKNTEQDTAINGKVAISQGTENAGKVLGIGSDGNVTPVDVGGSSGGFTIGSITTSTISSIYTTLKLGDIVTIMGLKSSSGGEIVNFIGMVGAKSGNDSYIIGCGSNKSGSNLAFMTQIVVQSSSITIYYNNISGGSGSSSSFNYSQISDVLSFKYYRLA